MTYFLAPQPRNRKASMCDEKRLVENCGCGCGGLHRLQLLDWHGLFRNGRRTVQLEGVAVDFVQENWIALSTLVVMLWGADLSKSQRSFTFYGSGSTAPQSTKSVKLRA
jgi:hypothetical protein